MSNPKRHHWWPECHSKLWTDREGCVTRLGRGDEPRRTRPINTAVIGHYNSVRHLNGQQDPALETYFANEVEWPAGPVLERLSKEKWRDPMVERLVDAPRGRGMRRQIREAGWEWDGMACSAYLPAEDRLALTRYVASLIVRVPSYKDALNSEAVRMSLAALLDLDAPQARFEADRRHVAILRQHIDEYSRRLIGCAVILLEAQEGEEFIIGDTPVIPAALGFGKAKAICPISPDRALIMISGWTAPFGDRIGVFRSTRGRVRSYNRVMLQNAEQEVFCRTAIPSDFVSKHLGRRQVRLSVEFKGPEAAGSDQGPMLDPASE